jgi:hypothetical protein
VFFSSLFFSFLSLPFSLLILPFFAFLHIFRSPGRESWIC